MSSDSQCSRLADILQACSLGSKIHDSQLVEIGNSSLGLEEPLVSELEALLTSPEAFAEACESLYWAAIHLREEAPDDSSPDKASSQGAGVASAQLYHLTQRLIFSLGSRDPETLAKIAKVFEATTSGQKDLERTAFKGFLASVLTQVMQELEARIFEQFRSSKDTAISRSLTDFLSTGIEPPQADQKRKGWDKEPQQKPEPDMVFKRQESDTSSVAKDDRWEYNSALQDDNFLPAKFPGKLPVLDYDPAESEGFLQLSWPGLSNWLETAARQFLGGVDSMAVRLDEAADPESWREAPKVQTSQPKEKVLAAGTGSVSLFRPAPGHEMTWPAQGLQLESDRRDENLDQAEEVRAAPQLAPENLLQEQGLPAYAALGETWIHRLLLLSSGSSYLYLVAPAPSGLAVDRQSSSPCFGLRDIIRIMRTSRPGLHMLVIEFEAGPLLLRFSFPEQMQALISAMTAEFRIPVLESWD